jgi:hypothetical protein
MYEDGRFPESRRRQSDRRLPRWRQPRPSKRGQRLKLVTSIQHRSNPFLLPLQPFRLATPLAALLHAMVWQLGRSCVLRDWLCFFEPPWLWFFESGDWLWLFVSRQWLRFFESRDRRNSKRQAAPVAGFSAWNRPQLD